MKKIIYVLSVITLFMSCGKDNTYSTEFASVSVINASPGTPIPQLFIDTLQKTASPIAYRGTSGYNTLLPGNRLIQLRNNLVLPIVRTVASANTNFDNGKAYTFLMYDTLATTSSTARLVRLNDDLTLPTSGNVHVRFAHLAINAPAVDVTYLRTPNNDSVTISGRAYLGAVPAIPAIQQTETFTRIPSGNYIVKLKLAGTQTVVSSTNFALTATSGIYTFFANGTAQMQPLVLSAVRNYP